MRVDLSAFEFRAVVDTEGSPVEILKGMSDFLNYNYSNKFKRRDEGFSKAIEGINKLFKHFHLYEFCDEKITSDSAWHCLTDFKTFCSQAIVFNEECNRVTDYNTYFLKERIHLAKTLGLVDYFYNLDSLHPIYKAYLKPNQSGVNIIKELNSHQGQIKKSETSDLKVLSYSILNKNVFTIANECRIKKIKDADLDFHNGDILNGLLDRHEDLISPLVFHYHFMNPGKPDFSKLEKILTVTARLDPSYREDILKKIDDTFSASSVISKETVLYMKCAKGTKFKGLAKNTMFDLFESIVKNENSLNDMYPVVEYLIKSIGTPEEIISEDDILDIIIRKDPSFLNALAKVLTNNKLFYFCPNLFRKFITSFDSEQILKPEVASFIQLDPKLTHTLIFKNGDIHNFNYALLDLVGNSELKAEALAGVESYYYRISERENDEPIFLDSHLSVDKSEALNFLNENSKELTFEIYFERIKEKVFYFDKQRIHVYGYKMGVQKDFIKQHFQISGKSLSSEELKHLKKIYNNSAPVEVFDFDLSKKDRSFFIRRIRDLRVAREVLNNEEEWSYFLDQYLKHIAKKNSYKSYREIETILKRVDEVYLVSLVKSGDWCQESIEASVNYLGDNLKEVSTAQWVIDNHLNLVKSRNEGNLYKDRIIAQLSEDARIKLLEREVRSDREHKRSATNIHDYFNSLKKYRLSDEKLKKVFLALFPDTKKFFVLVNDYPVGYFIKILKRDGVKKFKRVVGSYELIKQVSNVEDEMIEILSLSDLSIGEDGVDHFFGLDFCIKLMEEKVLNSYWFTPEKIPNCTKYKKKFIKEIIDRNPNLILDSFDDETLKYYKIDKSKIKKSDLSFFNCIKLGKKFDFNNHYRNQEPSASDIKAIYSPSEGLSDKVKSCEPKLIEYLLERSRSERGKIDALFELLKHISLTSNQKRTLIFNHIGDERLTKHVNEDDIVEYINYREDSDVYKVVETLKGLNYTTEEIKKFLDKNHSRLIISNSIMKKNTVGALLNIFDIKEIKDFIGSLEINFYNIDKSDFMNTYYSLKVDELPKNRFFVSSINLVVCEERGKYLDKKQLFFPGYVPESIKNIVREHIERDSLNGTFKLSGQIEDGILKYELPKELNNKDDGIYIKTNPTLDAVVLKTNLKEIPLTLRLKQGRGELFISSYVLNSTASKLKEKANEALREIKTISAPKIKKNISAQIEVRSLSSIQSETIKRMSVDSDIVTEIRTDYRSFTPRVKEWILDTTDNKFISPKTKLSNLSALACEIDDLKGKREIKKEKVVITLFNLPNSIANSLNENDSILESVNPFVEGYFNFHQEGKKVVITLARGNYRYTNEEEPTVKLGVFMATLVEVINLGVTQGGQEEELEMKDLKRSYLLEAISSFNDPFKLLEFIGEYARDLNIA